MVCSSNAMKKYRKHPVSISYCNVDAQKINDDLRSLQRYLFTVSYFFEDVNDAECVLSKMELTLNDVFIKIGLLDEAEIKRVNYGMAQDQIFMGFKNLISFYKEIYNLHALFRIRDLIQHYQVNMNFVNDISFATLQKSIEKPISIYEHITSKSNQIDKFLSELQSLSEYRGDDNDFFKKLSSIKKNIDIFLQLEKEYIENLVSSRDDDIINYIGIRVFKEFFEKYEEICKYLGNVFLLVENGGYDFYVNLKKAMESSVIFFYI
jgi:hypothetical protein